MRRPSLPPLCALTLLVVLGPALRAGEGDAWFPFDPKPDDFAESPMDLRFLNEKHAGEHGFIAAKDGRFVLGSSGRPIRFWAVNGPGGETRDRAALGRTARMLAKYGVNLVRSHGAVFDKDGEVDPRSVKRVIAIVEAMKAEGIYTHLSIYFPLWFTPRAGHPWMEGYDGKTHPFAALMFNPKFQEKYREWWKALLTTPSETTGKPLVREPALMGLELQNEDSFFFWTFNADRIPDAQMRILEERFGDWLARKYGSIDAAFKAWKGLRVKRDGPAEGRVSFRPLWNIFNEKTARDRDTTAFLFEVQTQFYRDGAAFLRKLGFKGLITASNWATASPEVFGPLEKLSYATCDFIDRHGYFDCNHEGDEAAWSIRNGHTYSDRSALRFEAGDPTKPRQFVHPVMDPQYDRKPSMISETTFCRPNRYRSEAPLYYAAYGALQESDCIVHFALDGDRWAVKPRFFMQQWTLMTPAMMGQFPAAALIFRRGLVGAGKVLAEVKLNEGDLLDLEGTPLPQDAALDELRLKDVPEGTELAPGQRIDPLIHYAGRVEVSFVTGRGSTKLTDLSPFVDHENKTVTSTTGELKLDYGDGVLTIDAPRAQGASGALRAAGKVDLEDLVIASEMELGHIIAVSLDDRPLATSSRILVQVMSEEEETNRRVEQVSATVKRIANIGTDPWRVRRLQGTVRFKRADAAKLAVTALDFNGYPVGPAGTAQEFRLLPATMYYFVSTARTAPRS
ncbi:MAG: hypothetical protein JXP34_14350 [Planctomycetes bacterium]|nr:hypothetical protein [Planctomycetota bacterium]